MLKHRSVFRPISFLFSALLLSFCTSERQAVTVSEEPTILATVNDIPITLTDLQERAELTPRPFYCAGNTLDDKTVILNSLIAEQLLAIEGQTERELTSNSFFKNYLAGIKEQTMRTRLLEIELEDKIHISDEEWTEAYNQATREFQVAFLKTEHPELASFWRKRIDAEGFTPVALDILGQAAPVEEIQWGQNLQALDEAIFHEDVDQGAVVGPIKTRLGYYIAEVVESKRRVEIGQESQAATLRRVENVLTNRKWLQHASEYVANITCDKRIQIDPDGLQHLYDYYLPAFAIPNTKEEFLSIADADLERLHQQSDQALGANLDQALLTIDESQWTIADFIQYSKRRPLKFRSSRIYQKDFAFHLKLALQDMLRDYFLTETAYEQGLENDPKVQHEVQRWESHILAIGVRNMWLKEYGFKGKPSEDPQIVFKLVRARLMSLAQRNDVKILVNESQLAEHSLSRFQMKVVRNPDAVYRDLVPDFPILTNEARLLYFQKE